GFGDIFMVTCKKPIPSIPEKIALKGVSVGEEDSGMSIKRFLSELKLHSRAKNDRIINFFGVSKDEDNDQYYLVMEFADEGDLRGYLIKKKSNIQWEKRLDLAIQIAEGIVYIHNELNIAHRDLLKATSLTPVFEESIVPEAEAPSDQYLTNINHNFASLSIIRDPSISTSNANKYVLSSNNLKDNSGYTVESTLGITDGMWDFIEKILSTHSDDSVIKFLILQHLETHKIRETEIFNALYDNEANANNGCLLGFFYYFGIGTNQNYDEAFELFSNAAQNSNWIAQVYLGNCYINGHGTQINEKSAFEHYKNIHF
ncbi:5373_t:CDS:2, partial [Gigaspora rosea]